MTNKQIEEKLKKLFPCKTEFSVVQTGKHSSRVNSLYKPATREIVLHNMNFKTENELIYTAVHELTHHILTTEKGVKTAKCHSGIFWSTFYDLLDSAIKRGFYSRTRSEETQKLVEEAKQIQKELAELQRKLGDVISKIYIACKDQGDRYEDVIEHDLQMTRNKARELVLMNGGKNSDELSKIVNSAKGVEAKAAAQNAIDNGKTVEQVKAIAKKKAKAVDDDLESPEQLRREEKRLEHTIERLSDRLVQVQETLKSMGADDD